MSDGWGMRDGSNTRFEHICPVNSTFNNDGDGRFGSMVCALRRGGNRLERGNMYLKGNPTAR